VTAPRLSAENIFGYTQGSPLVDAGSPFGSAFDTIYTWRPFEDAITAADSTGRFVMVAVYAPWCGWCRKMEAEVYPSEAVRSCLADHFVLTRLNRDDTETTHRYQGRRLTSRRLASTLRADGVPTTVLLSPRGEYLIHLSGYVEPTPLRTLLAYISTRAYRDVPYETFRVGSVDCDRDGAGTTN